MKITYQDKPIVKNPTLAELNSGVVFSFVTAQCAYMRCNMNGRDNLITNDCTDTWNAIEFTGREPFASLSEFEEDHDYDELIVCVSLTSGKVVLLYQDLEVIPLNCELVVNKG